MATRFSPAFAEGHALVANMRTLSENFYRDPADRNQLLRGRMWVVDGRKLLERPKLPPMLSGDDEDIEVSAETSTES